MEKRKLKSQDDINETCKKIFEKYLILENIGNEFRDLYFYSTSPNRNTELIQLFYVIGEFAKDLSEIALGAFHLWNGYSGNKYREKKEAQDTEPIADLEFNLREAMRRIYNATMQLETIFNEVTNYYSQNDTDAVHSKLIDLIQIISTIDSDCRIITDDLIPTLTLNYSSSRKIVDKKKRGDTNDLLQFIMNLNTEISDIINLVKTLWRYYDKSYNPNERIYSKEELNDIDTLVREIEVKISYLRNLLTYMLFKSSQYSQDEYVKIFIRKE